MPALTPPRTASTLPWGADMEVKTGLITAAEVNMPSVGGGKASMFSTDEPATWATVWFIVSIAFLLHVL